MHAEYNASRAIAILVTTALLLNAMAPTLAHAAIYLKGAEVNANTLVRDAYVQVTYRDSNDQERTEKGWIDAVNETSFTIRSGALVGKKIISYDKVLSVIMSNESTVPAKQMNEVNRFPREMKTRETEREAEQGAIQHLKQRLNARVRVQAFSILKKRITGRLVKMMQDTLVIQDGRTFYQVPITSISNFEVSLGQRRNTGKGLVIGLALNALLWGSVASGDDNDNEKNNIDLIYVLPIVTSAFLIIPIFMGAMIKSDKWVEVPPQSLNLSFAPTSTKGLRAALTFNF